MNYAAAVLTYFTKDILDRGRLDLFKRSIDSLVRSNFSGTIFVVDDGSEVDDHIKYIETVNDPRVVLHRKRENGGLSKAFNTGTRLVLESGCEYGFLCNDDIVYSEDWHLPYLEVMENTDVKHLCFFSKNVIGSDGIPRSVESKDHLINGLMLTEYSWVQGGVITFSKDQINKIGYFKVMPGKLGHEHSNFTIRSIAHGFCFGFLDVKGSEELLQYADETGEITTRGSDFLEQARQNAPYINSNDYDPCIE